MNEIKSRADLFEAAAKMMRMCDEAGIEYASKYDGMIENDWNYNSDIERYEFPLAVVEGKPVFKGDELYSSGCTKPSKIIIENCDGENLYGSGCCIGISYMSWLPPKPRTVMVELLREDAEYYANEKPLTIAELKALIERHKEACRKALEESK